MNKLILSALTGLAFVGLTGCKTDLAPELPFAEISGVAADNIIRNGDVRIYSWDGREREILMSTRTDQFGVYSDTLQAEDQFIKVCVTGGEYTEEASGINIRLESGDRLCAVTYWQSGSTQDVMVTPETNLATAYAECKAKNGSSNLQNIVSDANTRIGTLFGYNILTTMPADMTSDNLRFTGLNDSIRSGLWHAAFSRLALNAAKANGLSSHTQLISSIKLHQLLYKDLESDCKLDGYGLAANGQTRVPLSMGSFPLDETVYRAGLARELVSFVESSRNKTAVKAADVLSYATSYSVSSDIIFPNDQPAVPFDDQGPVIAWEVDSGTYVSGLFQVSLAVTDFSGVSTIEMIVNNEPASEVDVVNQTAIINTTRYQDGPVYVTIRATDKLNNTTVINRVLNVVNRSPVVNMTSKILVNSNDYLWTGVISDYPQGVVSASLNGKPATIADGNITAPATLSQGVNSLSLSVLDGAGVTHSYSWNVDLDRVSPVVLYKMGSWMVTLKDTVKDITTSAYMKTTFGVNEAVYVIPSRFSLKGVAVTDEALSSLNWPALRVEVMDVAAGSNTYFSQLKDLKVEIHYRDKNSGVYHFSRTVQPNDVGVVLIPLASEFLGENWWEKQGAVIQVVVTDEAGNVTNLNWDLPLSVSNPKINFPITSGSYVSGNMNLEISGSDLVGIDYISVSLNGGVPSTLYLNNLNYPLNAAGLPDGLHYITINVVSDGTVVSTNTYEFTVDNTPPTLSVSSSTLVKQAGYRLIGTAFDAGSGLASVTANGTALNLGSFDKSYTLVGGHNDFNLTAVDAAGNSTSLLHRVIYDAFPPTFNSATSADSSILVRYGKTHSPFVNWLSFSANNEPFYIDESIISIGGLDMTNPSSESILGNKKYPHFGVSLSDIDIPGGDQVSKSDLTLYMTVRFGSEKIVDMRKLDPVIPTYRYLVPVTVEYFTERLRDVSDATIITVTFTAEDKAGNTRIQEHQFRAFILPIDEIAPVLTTDLSNNSWWNSTKSFALDIAENFGLSSVKLFINGSSVASEEWAPVGSKNYSVAFPFVDEGSHVATYRVIDLAGNESTITRVINIDKTSPVVSIDANTIPSVATSPFTLRWNITEQNLQSIVLFDGVSNIQLGPNINSYSITPTGTEGVKQIRVTATDKAGNVATANANSNWQHVPPVATITHQARQVRQDSDIFFYMDNAITFDSAVTVKSFSLAVRDHYKNDYRCINHRFYNTQNRVIKQQSPTSFVLEAWVQQAHFELEPSMRLPDGCIESGTVVFEDQYGLTTTVAIATNGVATKI